jgi:hypothetical protein
MKKVVVVFSVVLLFVAIAVSFLSITNTQNHNREDWAVLTSQEQRQHPVYKGAKRNNNGREVAVENYSVNKTTSPVLLHKKHAVASSAKFLPDEGGASFPIDPKASSAAGYSPSFSSSSGIFSGVAPRGGASAASEQRHGFMAVNSANNSKVGLPVQQLATGEGVDPDNGSDDDLGPPLAVGSGLWILLFFILFYSAVKQLRLFRF